MLIEVGEIFPQPETGRAKEYAAELFSIVLFSLVTKLMPPCVCLIFILRPVAQADGRKINQESPRDSKRIQDIFKPRLMFYI